MGVKRQSYTSFRLIDDGIIVFDMPITHDSRLPGCVGAELRSFVKCAQRYDRCRSDLFLISCLDGAY